MKDHTRITIHYIDGTDQTVVVDFDGEKAVVKLYPEESCTVAHFGRDDGTGWYELIAAPLSSIRSWD